VKLVPDKTDNWQMCTGDIEGTWDMSVLGKVSQHTQIAFSLIILGFTYQKHIIALCVQRGSYRSGALTPSVPELPSKWLGECADHLSPRVPEHPETHTCEISFQINFPFYGVNVTWQPWQCLCIVRTASSAATFFANREIVAQGIRWVKMRH
jgi:hypothetical protein